jgi:16S rRNA (cytosine967-C5)-methyltransferase
MSGISAPRRISFDILRRVASGAWASELLRAATAGLDSRDAGLAEEIVFGVLRYQGQLDHVIGIATGKPAARLDIEVAVALRMGLYQSLYLDRIPAHAAVKESVELVKRASKRSAAGLVNAVLRRADQFKRDWPDEATELSVPAWLFERWKTQFGVERARAIATAFLKPPEAYVRWTGPPAAKLEPTEVPGCYRLLSKPGGAYRRQDISSQWVVTLLDLQPGQSFLDLCAAPGNKTAQALEHGVWAVACDLHVKRLATLSELDCERVALDATEPLPFRKKFDRILADVPCSGTGTLARNPEIKWRLRPEDLTRLQATQTAILQQALDCLAPGGLLVYSTCSLEEEENEAVVRAVLGLLPDVRRRLSGQDPGDSFFAAMIRSE